MGPDAMNFIFWSILSQLFHSLLSPSSRGVFCHWSGIIHLSEITAISPGNLDFSLWFIQPSISHDVLWLFNQGDSVQPWHTLSPILNQSIIPCLVLTVASWPAYRFLRRQVRWSGIAIFLRIFHSLEDGYFEVLACHFLGLFLASIPPLSDSLAYRVATRASLN